MNLSIRQVTIDGRPLIGMIVDRGIIIPLDRTDTVRLIENLQTELRKLPWSKED